MSVARTAEERRREATSQSRSVEVTSGGPGALIATYPGTAMRSKDHAKRVATVLKAKGWRASVGSDNTVTATAVYSR
jgi:hypothetical protein